MSQSTMMGGLVADLIMKHAEKVTDGPMNTEAAKITALVEALEEALKQEVDLLCGEAKLVAAKLYSLPDMLRRVHRKELARRVEALRDELIHRTAPVY